MRNGGDQGPPGEAPPIEGGGAADTPRETTLIETSTTATTPIPLLALRLIVGSLPARCLLQPYRERRMSTPPGDEALTEDDLDPDPIAQVAAWLEDARDAGLLLPD